MKKWRRRHYLINRSVQPRYMGMVALLVLIMSMLAAWVVYSTMWLTLSEALSEDPLLHLRFAELNILLIGRFSLVILAGMALSVLVTMFISHRIAGPMFRLRRTLAEISGGKIPRTVSLRRKDEFVELAEAVNAVISKIEGMTRADRQILSGLRGLLDGGAPAEEIKAELDRLEFFQEESA